MMNDSVCRVCVTDKTKQEHHEGAHYFIYVRHKSPDQDEKKFESNIRSLRLLFDQINSQSKACLSFLHKQTICRQEPVLRA